MRHSSFASLPLLGRTLAPLLLGGALLAIGAPSCSLVIDGSADSCESDADCVNYANTGCDTEQGVCISLDKCQSNAECPGDQICRPFSPRTCVSLKSGNPSDASAAFCNEIYPADEAVWRDDTTILIGLTAPLTEQITENGPFDLSSTGQSILHGAKLGVLEVNEKGGVDKRKLALVICDDHGNRGPAVDNGEALAKMGIQAVIGAAYSGQTLDMTTGVGPIRGTVAQGVLTISSSATSPDITGIKDIAPACAAQCGNDETCRNECPGLVWRTSPSDKLQGAAINQYFVNLEPTVKQRSGMTQNTINVTVLHKGDSYGVNLADVVRTGLIMNGQKASDIALQPGNFVLRNYGDSSNNEPLNAAEIQATLSDAPDVVMLLGTSEIAEIIDTLEAAAWPGGEALRPYYILADGGLGTDITNSVVAAGAQARVRGTVPGTLGPLFVDFGSAYTVGFPDAFSGPEIAGAAGAYDIVYLLTYSAVASGNQPLTGEQLARGLSKTVGGTAAVPVGKAEFGTASNTLQSGGAIDFDGASGPLNFDLSTGEADSDIQIWCVTGAGATPLSGRYFDAKTGGMAGQSEPNPMAYSCPF